MRFFRLDQGPGPQLLLLAVVFATFANGLTGAFVWDDLVIVVRNETAHGFSHLPELLGWGDARFQYRILRDFSHMIDYTLGGLEPFVYHLFNVVYHAGTTLLVYALARRITESHLAALFAGLLFAVHPVHVDSVTYISGRRDVLSTLFYLASLMAYIRFRDPAGRRGWFVLAVVCALLGVMTKEMAATIPGAWFLYDLWRTRERTSMPIVKTGIQVIRNHWHLYGTGLVFAGGYMAYFVFFQPSHIGFVPHGGSWPNNFMTVTVILAHAVRLLWMPTGLLLDYDGYFAPVLSPADGRFLLAAGCMIAIAAACYPLAKNSRAGMFSCHWLWITYLPAMQLIPIAELFAEHYLYLPSVGAAILGGMALAALCRTPKARTAGIVMGVALTLLFAAMTWDRNRDFRDPVTAYEAELRVFPNSPRAFNNLAYFYRQEGRYDEELVTWQRLLDQWPARGEGWIGLGNAARVTGRQKVAVQAFWRAIQILPDEPRAWRGLGVALQATGDMDGAVKAFNQVLERVPDDGDAWNNLGVIHMMNKEVAQAEHAFQQAQKSSTVPEAAYLNLARLMIDDNRCESARKVIAKAIDIKGISVESPAYLKVRARYVERCVRRP